MIIPAEEWDLERPGRVQAGWMELAGIEAAAEMGGRKDGCGLGRKGASIYLGPAACQVS